MPSGKRQLLHFGSCAAAPKISQGRPPSEAREDAPAPHEGDPSGAGVVEPELVDDAISTIFHPPSSYLVVTWSLVYSHQSHVIPIVLT